MSSVNLNDLTVVQLKELLKEFQLSTTGSKAELIVKLREADSSGDRLREHIANMQRSESTTSKDSYTSRDVEDRESDVEYMRRQMELMRREREVADRELEIARREITLLKQMQELNVQPAQPAAVESVSRPAERPKISVTAVADLLCYFDGSSSMYERWEKQVRSLRRTYNLQEDASKFLVGSRLKGKVVDWFHSRPEFMEMPIEV